MALTVTATDTELQKPVNVVFQQTFLRRAQQMCPYFLGTMPGQINRQMGTSTIKWRRIEQETPSTAALSELTGASTYMQGRDADTPTFTDVLATLSKYGQFYIVNEEVDLYNPNGTTDELVAVLGESAGRSLNQLMRDIMEDNATKRYAGNVASDGVVDAAVTVGDFDRIVNELTKNSARCRSCRAIGASAIPTWPTTSPSSPASFRSRSTPAMWRWRRANSASTRSPAGRSGSSSRKTPAPIRTPATTCRPPI